MCSPISLHTAPGSSRSARPECEWAGPRLPAMAGPPSRLFHAATAEILDESQVASGVAGDDVEVAVGVPIEADRRGQRAELEIIGLLLEIARRQELGHAI